MVEFPDASIAAIELTKNGIEFYRNGQRPLYYIEHNDLVVVGSTKRSLEYFGEPKMCAPGFSYFMHKSYLVAEFITEVKEDLQV